MSARFSKLLFGAAAGVLACLAQQQGATTGKLANGVYAILNQGATAEQARAAGRPHRVLIYDRKYSDADRDQPPKYLALDVSSFVPLILGAPPDTRKDDRGWTLLSVTLAQQHVKTLEDFTRAHQGGEIATVIDGEVITIHKVRGVIRDGKAQITRCTDDACRTLYLKLTKPSETQP